MFYYTFFLDRVENGWLYHLCVEAWSWLLRAYSPNLDPISDRSYDKIRLLSHQRCSQCPRKEDKKTRDACYLCGRSICEEHSLYFCVDCVGEYLIMIDSMYFLVIHKIFGDNWRQPIKRWQIKTFLMKKISSIFLTKMRSFIPQNKNLFSMDSIELFS